MRLEIEAELHDAATVSKSRGSGHLDVPVADHILDCQPSTGCLLVATDRANFRAVEVIVLDFGDLELPHADRRGQLDLSQDSSPTTTLCRRGCVQVEGNGYETTRLRCRNIGDVCPSPEPACWNMSVCPAATSAILVISKSSSRTA